MKQLSGTMAVIVLGGFLACPVAHAKITRVPVPKGSKIETELGYTISVTPNKEHSGLSGTVTVEVRAPRTPKLQHLARIILRMQRGKELTGRLPLELEKGKAGEVLSGFQLAPAELKGSVLELVCPVPNMPNGVIYDIDLSAYVTSAER